MTCRWTERKVIEKVIELDEETASAIHSILMVMPDKDILEYLEDAGDESDIELIHNLYYVLDQHFATDEE